MKPPKLKKPVRKRVTLPDGTPRLNALTGKESIVYICPHCLSFSSNRKHIKECCQQHFECLIEKWGRLIGMGIEVSK